MGKRINYYTNLIYFIIITLIVTIRICADLELFTFLGDGVNYIMGFVTQIGLFFLLPLFLFKYFNKVTFRETFSFLGFKKISFKMILVSVGLGVVVFFLNVYVSSFFNMIIQSLGYTPNSSLGGEMGVGAGALFLNLFVTAILPAVCEEFLHRGMLLKGNSPRGMLKSILISGFLFGLLHLNIEQFFYATLIGLFLGYLCWGCNSIYPCMIVHFMNNAISVFISFGRANGWGIGIAVSKITEFLSLNTFLGIAIMVCVLVLLLMLAKELTFILIKDSFNFSFSKRQKELANMAIRENYFKQIEDIKNNQTPMSIYSTNKNTIYIDFKDFMNYVTKNLENLEKSKDKKNKITNIEIKTKILLYGSIFLSAAVTIFTFIWGLFR